VRDSCSFSFALISASVAIVPFLLLYIAYVLEQLILL